MSNQFPTLHIVDHPLVQHKLSVMRDKNTSVKDFRALVGEIAMLLTYEATRDLPMTTRTIETPHLLLRGACAGRQEAGHRPHPAGRTGL